MTVPSRAGGRTALLAATTILSLVLGAAAARAQGTSPAPGPDASAAPREAMRAVAPALERYATETLFGDLWRRPQLSTRDRSLVTLAALVARNQPGELSRVLDVALESGVRPAEISELVTHLAFYAGWGNAMAALPAVRDAFSRRGVGADGLPPASPDLLPLDEAAEARRASRVEADIGDVTPGLNRFTTDLLFRDLWRRPGLAPRDRSLVTVSALIATGSVAQVPYHLNRAMDNGLTRAEAGEVVTHLAFYAGWPNAFSAVPVVKEVLGNRRG